MDEEKCAEVALDYMINKYGKDFILIDSSEKMQIAGPAGYAEVEMKTAESENSYYVLIYPDGKSDKNNDGYYDKYKVISDDYMSDLLSVNVKEEMDKILKEVGMVNFISRVYVMQMKGGFSADFPLLFEKQLLLNDMLQKYKINIQYWIYISESEYKDELQANITKNVQKLLTTDDYVYVGIYVYTDKKFNEMKEFENRNIGYDIGVGIKNIEFVVKKED